MDNNTQDIFLINDIIDRNYYKLFQEDNPKKHITLCFFGNNNYNNSKFYPDNTVENNEQKILNNFELFLDFYINNNFNANIYLEDELLLTNIEFFNKIIAIIDKKYSNINGNFYISLYSKDLYNNINLEYLQQLQEKYNLFYKIVSNNIQLDIYNNIILELSKNNIIELILNPEDMIFINENKQNVFNFINKNSCYTYEQDSENWNEKNIELYCSFLLEYILFMSQSDSNFIQHLFQKDFSNRIISFYDAGIINNTNTHGKCNLHNNLCILLDNMSIIMCRKLQYSDLSIGNLSFTDNKIIPNNIPISMIPTHLKRSSTPHCEYCRFLAFCKGFCYGDVYNKILNPIIPIRQTCEMKKSKYTFIFYTLKQLNILNNDIIQKINIDETYKEHFLIIFNNIINNLGGNINAGIS